jgi:hypothetical protein
MEAWPDFYLVGAPKAGTTSLFDYLQRYPEFFLPEQKEVLFFGTDLDVRDRHRRSAAEFQDLYREAPAGAKRGTAYVWYLYSRTAAAEIRAVRPDARIIIALRDPVAALYALHSEFVYDGNEDLVDFAAALAAEPERCAGRRIPAEAHFADGLCYRRTVRYAQQVQRYLDRFGREQVHVLLFDDLLADPRATGMAVARFLGVEPRPEVEFPHANPNKRSRSRVVRRFLASPPASLRRGVRAVVPSRLRRLAYRRVKALNAATPERTTLDPTLARQLRSELDASVAELEGVLGRPLTGWRAAP